MRAGGFRALFSGDTAMTKKNLLPLLLLLTSLVLTSCARPPAAMTREDKLRNAAGGLVAALAKQNYALVEEGFDAPMKNALPPDRLRELWEALLNGAGPFQQPTKTQISMEKQGDKVYHVVLVKCQFERAAINTRVVFNQGDQVTGLFFIPASE